MSIRSIHITILCFALTSCGAPKEVDASEYILHVEDPANGLYVSKTIEEIEFSLQYKPEDYQLLRMGADKARAQGTEGIKADCFNLRVAVPRSVGAPLNYLRANSPLQTDLVSYLSFGLQDDIFLVRGADTVNCSMSQFVRNYQLAPHLDFALTFPGTTNSNAEDLQVIIEDKAFLEKPLESPRAVIRSSSSKRDNR